MKYKTASRLIMSFGIVVLFLFLVGLESTLWPELSFFRYYWASVYEVFIFLIGLTVGIIFEHLGSRKKEIRVRSVDKAIESGMKWVGGHGEY